MESMRFSVDEMVKEIYSNMDSVDELLSQVDIGTDLNNLSDDEKVNLVLRIAYISASNNRRQNYGDSLVDNDLEAEIGFMGDKAKQFDKYQKWFDKYKNTGHRFIVCDKETKNPLGYFSFKFTDEISNSGLVAIKLVTESRGKKIGTDTLKTGMSFLFNKINVRRLHTHIISYNKASENLFLKCHWTKEGTERESIYMNNLYHDNNLFSILKNEYLESEEDDDYLELFKYS